MPVGTFHSGSTRSWSLAENVLGLNHWFISLSRSNCSFVALNRSALPGFCHILSSWYILSHLISTMAMRVVGPLLVTLILGYFQASMASSDIKCSHTCLSLHPQQRFCDDDVGEFQKMFSSCKVEKWLVISLILCPSVWKNIIPVWLVYTPLGVLGCITSDSDSDHHRSDPWKGVFIK